MDWLSLLEFSFLLEKEKNRRLDFLPFLVLVLGDVWSSCDEDAGAGVGEGEAIPSEMACNLASCHSGPPAFSSSSSSKLRGGGGVLVSLPSWLLLLPFGARGGKPFPFPFTFPLTFPS